MSKFKPGDTVTPVNVDCGLYSEGMKRLLGKTLLVLSVGDGKNGDEFVCAGEPGSIHRFWFADDLRLVSAWSAEQFQAEATDTAQNPLKRGDLVTRYGSSLCVVVDVAAGGTCWIHPIAGEGSQDYFHFEELTKVGSIRKKAKRLLKQMECEK